MSGTELTGNVRADLFLAFAGLFGVFISLAGIFALVFFAYVGLHSEEFHPVAAGLCTVMITIGVWNTIDSILLINAPNWLRFKFILMRSALAASPLVAFVILTWIRA